MNQPILLSLLRPPAALLLCLPLWACKPAPPPVATPDTTPTAQQPEANGALLRLFDEEWQRGLREHPVSATFLGDSRYNDRWDEMTLEAYARREAADREALARLARIPRTQLAPTNQLNYDLFRQLLEETIEGYAYGGHLRPAEQRSGIQTAHELAESIRFASMKDYQDWITRLQTFGVYMDQTIGLMQQGIVEGRAYPRAVMQRVSGQIRKQLVEEPAQSPFYTPFLQMSAELDTATQQSLRMAAQAAIRTQVVPAFQRFDTFFNQQYLPACPEAVGLSAQRQGAEYYAFLARTHTTTRLTPERIHEIGLKEVERIRGQMQKILQQVGFKGELPAFFDFLRRDPQFFYKTPQELFDGYALITKRIDPELVRLFGKLPRTPYGVRAISDVSAPDTTTAYYFPPSSDGKRAGYYYVNLYKPETRPKWEMEALTMHEAVPGHHLQLSLQQELGELPNFRKFGGYTAYVEGWALYSESLGGELGLYQDPYSRFGQLTYEMWRAVRLVVDTGMHAKGWSREQAIEFFRNNAAKTELDIVNEIDRYLVMPGQALAYKIGQLKISELRQRAETRLGERFDVRAFHDAVLEAGAIPLELLEQRIDAWIARLAG